MRQITAIPMPGHVLRFVAHVKTKSDQLTNYFLASYFAAGIFLSTYYDTLEIALWIGGICISAYYLCRYLLPESNLYQYVLSTNVGIFMAQYIYQMHGMFEMHFFAFIGSAILITYQNWKLQIPLAIVVVVHHAVFGYLQYIGYDEIYFTQLDYMTLQTFIIHGVLATVIFFLCGLWAYNFKKSGEEHVAQSFEIGKLQEANSQKEKLVELSEDLQTSNGQLREAQKLAKMGNWSYNISSNELTWSDGLREIYGLSPDFPASIEGGLALIHPEDRKDVLNVMSGVQENGNSTHNDFRLIKPSGEMRIMTAKTHAVMGDDGKPARIYGIIQDITERKNAEAAEAKNKDITASIVYTQRLQKALFPNSADLKRHFPKSFVFNRPQDIVGGDFYWIHEANGNIIISCVDCTGHGVPGAFMSILGVDLLNKIVRDQGVLLPAGVLTMLNNEINHSIGQAREDGVMDGMDLSYCKIISSEKKILFAGAMSSVILVSSGEVKLIRGSRYTIGGHQNPSHKSFETVEVHYQTGDMMYMFTDGYVDQFGGINNKRFKLAALLELITSIHLLSTREQHRILIEAFESWKGDHEQTDDVLLLGLELP